MTFILTYIFKKKIPSPLRTYFCFLFVYFEHIFAGTKTYFKSIGFIPWYSIASSDKVGPLD